MAWARYDDALPFHRKVAALRANGVNGVAALGLHLLANTWSRHEGTLGFIPDYMPEQLAGRGADRFTDLLVAVGMFDECDAGWMIHNFEQYSPSGDANLPVDEKKARISKVRAQAGRRGGIAKARKQASKPSSKTVANEVANRWQSSSPDPVPEPRKALVADVDPKPKGP